MTSIFDTVIACEATYEVLEFRIGKTNDEVSRLSLKVTAQTPERLEQTLGDLMALGCYRLEEKDVNLKASSADRCVPEDFYSTTNQKTEIRYQSKWLTVRDQRMDAVVCVSNGSAQCRKLRDVRQGDMIVTGKEGIRVIPEFKERDRLGFAFMANEISSERR